MRSHLNQGIVKITEMFYYTDVYTTSNPSKQLMHISYLTNQHKRKTNCQDPENTLYVLNRRKNRLTQQISKSKIKGVSGILCNMILVERSAKLHFYHHMLLIKTDNTSKYKLIWSKSKLHLKTTMLNILNDISSRKRSIPVFEPPRVDRMKQ